jgi:hypothetical protein
MLLHACNLQMATLILSVATTKLLLVTFSDFQAHVVFTWHGTIQLHFYISITHTHGIVCAVTCRFFFRVPAIDKFPCENTNITTKCKQHDAGWALRGICLRESTSKGNITWTLNYHSILCGESHYHRLAEHAVHWHTERLWLELWIHRVLTKRPAVWNKLQWDQADTCKDMAEIKLAL